jgi:hypothetical protein
MLTLREQLQHEPFRLWTQKKPNLRSIGQLPPWRVYVQRLADGNWAFADFHTWEQAYRYVAKNLKVHYDMALHCRRQAFQPPVVRVAGVRRAYSPAPADYSHEWCGYCRRMTQFRFFINARHPAIKVPVDPTVKRCVICGVRLGFLKPYRVSKEIT